MIPTPDDLMRDLDLSPVLIDAHVMVRTSDMRAVEKMTGLTFGQVMDAGTADTFQAMAFMELRRRIRNSQPTPVRGVYVYPDPGELWEAAAEVDVSLGEETPMRRPDPLGATSF